MGEVNPFKIGDEVKVKETSRELFINQHIPLSGVLAGVVPDTWGTCCFSDSNRQFHHGHIELVHRPRPVDTSPEEIEIALQKIKKLVDG